MLEKLGVPNAKVSAIQEHQCEEAREALRQLKEIRSKEDWDRHVQWLRERPARRAAALIARRAPAVPIHDHGPLFFHF